jgi:hypothetical protein
MTRLYAATGDGIARLDELGEAWTAELFLPGSAAQCLAVDSADPYWWYVSASTGPFAVHGRGDPKARIYQRRDGQPWQPFAGGLPEPLPAMPYVLVATDGLLVAGLADGELWESRDGRASWTRLRLEGDDLNAVLALAHART